MGPLHSPNEYLFHLYTTSSGEAKRMWRKNIKEEWGHKCAYCESEENLTIDHIAPQSKGGLDVTKNVVCCCHDCNQSKGHTPWEDWYFSQEFFSQENYQKIKNWMKPDPPVNLFSYRPRRNNAT
jgi:5-methylcytosine-specific restriction endonuclease McrA